MMFLSRQHLIAYQDPAKFQSLFRVPPLHQYQLYHPTFPLDLNVRKKVWLFQDVAINDAVIFLTDAKKRKPSFSTINIQSDGEEIEMISLLRKIEHLVISNAQRTEEKVEACYQRLDGLEKKMDLVLRNSSQTRAATNELIRVSVPSHGQILFTDINFCPIETVEQLQNFNQLLEIDAEYRKKVQHWLQRSITRADIDNRLHDAIDALFSKARVF